MRSCEYSGIESTTLYADARALVGPLIAQEMSMPRYLFLLAVFFSLPVLAQFNDDLSDGDFTNDPAWSGDDALFIVVEEGGDHLLRSNSAGAATYHLSTPSSLATNAQWEFFVDLRFATSGSNYVDVYLISQQADLNPQPDGYFVRVGETQDHIVLYRSQGGANTALVTSPAGIVNSSTSNPFRVRVTRDADHNWTLAYDDGDTGMFVIAGTAVDASITTSTHFGIRIVQSAAGSVVNNHFFDDFIVGDIPVDEQPPGLLSVSVIDENTVDLHFDEPLSPGTAQDAANYSADNGLGQPLSATLQEAGIVRLVFASTFTSGTTYTVTVDGVQDLAGNAISNGTGTFVYFIAATPEYREVVFNELMVDPTPSQGLPEAEYIELFNTTTDKFFDLSGWSITTNSSQSTLPAYALAPGEYVLLVNNNTMGQFTTVENKLGISLSSTALVNGGTTLTLSANGEVIDQLTYDLGWYGDPEKEEGGWSLEQIHPYHPCSTSSNWAAATASLGGTPGTQNSIFSNTSDNDPPQLQSAQLIGTMQVELLFNEPLDEASIAGAEFIIEPALGISSAGSVPGDPRRVLLQLAAEPELEVPYTITVSGLTDCIGNTIGAENTATFFYYIPATPEYREVVINELMVDPNPPQGLPESEYIELFNATTDKYFQLEGWKISTTSSQAILPAFALAPGSFVVFVNNGQLPFFADIPNSAGFSLSSTAFTNAGTMVSLLDPQDMLVDRVAYTDQWYADPDRAGGGWSLEQVNPFHPCSTMDNWAASQAAEGGTPGTQNILFDPAPDTEPPMLLSAFMVDSTLVQLHFSEAMDLASLEMGEYSIDPFLDITGVDISSERRVWLTLADEPQIGTTYTVTVTNVYDCSGNAIGGNTAQIAIPELVAPGDVVINEVLYDTETGGSDFVELYNRSNKVIDLAGMKIGRELTDTARIITEDAWILMPGTYAVATSSIANVERQYPQSLTDRSIQMNLPSFTNTEGTVILMGADNEVIDQFRYHDNMHFALISRTKGFSLERIDPFRQTQDPTNWQTASEMAGRATPGYENSQYSPAPEAAGTMTIDPPIFSPDNDGHQDVVTITYEFNDHGFVGTLIIFDTAGREVKRLLNSHLLGTSGSVSWDGVMENGSKGRMGPYIVMLEAFDIDGNLERFKQTITLAHYLD